MELFQVNIFILLEKYVKYIKLFKIQDTGYYDINVTFKGSRKDGLLEFIKFKFRHDYSLFCIWKKGSKVFGKSIVTFRHNFAYMVNSFVFIIYDNYD